MAKSNTALSNELRDKYLAMLEEKLTEGDNLVLRVPLAADSESEGYQLAIPEIDEERNERTILIHISVPRGKRDGTMYDPFEENERYKDIVARKQVEREERAKKKEREEAEKQRKRELRKTEKKKKKKEEEE